MSREAKTPRTMTSRTCFPVTCRGKKPNNGRRVELAIVTGLDYRTNSNLRPSTVQGDRVKCVTTDVVEGARGVALRHVRVAYIFSRYVFRARLSIKEA
jgi:hypothetical protein